MVDLVARFFGWQGGHRTADFTCDSITETSARETGSVFEQNSQPVISTTPLRKNWTSRTAGVGAVLILTFLGAALVYQATKSHTTLPGPAQEIAYAAPVGAAAHSRDVLVEGPLVSVVADEIHTSPGIPADAVSAKVARSSHSQDVLVEGPLVSAFLGRDFTVSQGSSAGAEHGQDVLVEGPLVSAVVFAAGDAVLSE